MKKISLFVFYLVFIQCVTISDFGKLSNIKSVVDLQIGKQVFDDQFSIRNNTMLLTSSGQFWPYFDKDIEGIKYSIAYSPETRKITYISTQDSHFKTLEGLKIGDNLNNFEDDLKSAVIRERGWAFYIKLPSGWNAAFTQGSTMTEGKLKENSIVKWFFKR